MALSCMASQGKETPMSKRRKNWRERKTPESLAQERWLDAQVERIVVAALTRTIIERTNRFWIL